MNINVSRKLTDPTPNFQPRFLAEIHHSCIEQQVAEDYLQ
jgi:hypothetical protein